MLYGLCIGFPHTWTLVESLKCSDSIVKGLLFGRLINIKYKTWPKDSTNIVYEI